MQEVIPKRRNFIRSNSHLVENATETAKVTMLLLPSVRASIFNRLINGSSSIEVEAMNNKIDRRTVMSVLRHEHRVYLRRREREAYLNGRRDALLGIPPSGPAAAKAA